MNPSKKKILEHAFNLFLTESYSSVSMQNIQNACGLSRGAIYHHFKSKEEIFGETVNEYLIPAFSSYSLIQENEKSSLQNMIYASIKCRQSHVNLLKEATSFNLVDFYFFKFIFQASEHCKDFTEQINLLSEKEFNGWRNTTQLAMRTGEIRSDIDIDYVAQSFMTIPLGLGVFSAFSNYININTKDVRTSYLRFYTLLKKPGFI